MKSLMLKDFYVLRKQLWLYATIVLLFQTFPNGMGLFITFLYAAMLPATAFAYDDRSKWDMMELMMPYSTRQIVLSRYCVGWIAAPCLAAFGLLARRLMARASWIHIDGVFDLRVTLAGLFVALSFMAVTMPLYFRFDAEKSRLARMLILVLCGAMGGGMAAAGIAGGAILPDGMSRGVVWGALAAAAVLTAASVPLSMLAWKRRHR
ncbi:MAG: ABC-2 transporter permease [Oscillibacter sp.]|nr:ABC-2 transporter permease [Oscillibacter sp.]